MINLNERNVCQVSLQRKLTYYYFHYQEFEKQQEKMTEFNKIQSDIVTLNVGGKKFTTSLQTLRAEPESMLGVMFSGRHPCRKQDDGSIFIDRDGTHFRIILNYLRGSITSIQQLPDDNITLSDLSSESQYYQLTGLRKIIESAEKEQITITQSDLTESMEKKQTEITQSDLDKNFPRDEDMFGYTTKDLSFRNCRLDNLIFERIDFNHSIDLTDCSLVNTKFSCCYFADVSHCSFDHADLDNCTFEDFYNVDDLIKAIKSKRITFYDAKNIEFAKFDEKDVLNAVKKTYKLQ